MTAELAAAYRHCRALAACHYENFPVASRALPAALRDPIAAIYAFARGADDAADEGDAPPAARLARLQGYTDLLEAIAVGATPADPAGLALADTIRRHRLPLELFHDLLSAFRQDVTCRRYRDFPELLDYCRRSANPVGRLLLHLNGAAEPDNLVLSDRICTTLQLINFYQDLRQDYAENGRIYIPLDEMAAFGVDEGHFRDGRNDAPMRALMQHQWARARALMEQGAPLGRRLRGRFGWEIRLVVAAGLLVLERLKGGADLFARPRLRRVDYLRIGWRAIGPAGRGGGVTRINHE